MQIVTTHLQASVNQKGKRSKKSHYATIGTKYQVVIPKQVREKLKIKPGDKLYISLNKENTIYLTVSPRNWAEQNFGALKKYWKGIDLVKEVERIRNESSA